MFYYSFFNVAQRKVETINHWIWPGWDCPYPAGWRSQRRQVQLHQHCAVSLLQPHEQQSSVQAQPGGCYHKTGVLKPDDVHKIALQYYIGRILLYNGIYIDLCILYNFIQNNKLLLIRIMFLVAAEGGCHILHIVQTNIDLSCFF